MKAKISKAKKHVSTFLSIVIGFFIFFFLWETIGLIHQFATYITHLPFK